MNPGPQDIYIYIFVYMYVYVYPTGNVYLQALGQFSKFDFVIYNDSHGSTTLKIICEDPVGVPQVSCYFA